MWQVSCVYLVSNYGRISSLPIPVDFGQNFHTTSTYLWHLKCHRNVSGIVIHLINSEIKKASMQTSFEGVCYWYMDIFSCAVLPKDG